MSARGKILVIRGGAIGDFILTLPVFSALRAQFPEAHLEVLGYSHIANLALLGGLVEQVRSIESRPLAGFFARGGKLSEELQEYFSSFAVIISYLYDPDKIFQTNVLLCTKAQFLAAPHRPDETQNAPAALTFLKPLERLAIFTTNPIPRLLPPGNLPLTENRIAVHPGSGSPKKNWPETKWAELLEKLLRETDAKILLVGGEAEGSRLNTLSKNLPAHRIEMAENLPLVELAPLLQRSRVFIGHDSGISHLAAAVGLPGLILWGETRLEIWRPPQAQIQILRHDQGLPHIETEEVLTELKKILETNPTGDRPLF
ncbi:MAG: glycosyltransferase family 9 protein [Verrucomicrobiota bacterium]